MRQNVSCGIENFISKVISSRQANSTFVPLLPRKVLLTTNNLANDFLLHVRGHYVPVEMGLLEIRALTVFAVEVFRSAVRTFYVRFEINRRVVALVADFTKELWRFVVNQMLLHALRRFESLPTHRTSRLLSWVEWDVERLPVSLKLVGVGEVPMTIGALVLAQSKMTVEMPLQGFVAFEGSRAALNNAHKIAHLLVDEPMRSQSS